MIPERSWPDGIEPVLYFGFDTLTNLQLKEGSVDGHFSAVVSGKVSKMIIYKKNNNPAPNRANLI